MREVHQVALEPGQSQVVKFIYTPLEAKTFLVTVDGASGSFVCNPAPGYPGWTPGTVVYEIIVTPTVLYLGQTVNIVVDIEGPWPATYPMNIEATINVDGTTLSNIFSIDFRNPGLLFTYTPTKVGEYTVTAQNKIATFTVLANPIGTYYSPFGGTRMPLCTDIVFPNVPPFILRHGTIGTIVFSWPGGDLKYSDLYGHSTSLFLLLAIEGLGLPQEVLSLIPSAEPCAWKPSNAVITAWIKALNTGSLGSTISDILVMATEYTCQEYWDSKDELAKMIATFIGSGYIKYPSDWKSQYSVTCPRCGGTGQILCVEGMHACRPGAMTTCPTCGGTGKVWRINLTCGLRDWVKSPIFNAYKYANTPFTLQIRCPYCNQWVTRTYTDDPGYSGRLDVARDLIEHIETVHPNHPLTEPAWF